MRNMTNRDPQDSLPFGRLMRGVSAYADSIADGMRRYQHLVLFLFSGLYFADTGFRAARKLFWFDELFTLYLSRLPDMRSVWEALKIDLNPPLFYVITRFVQSLAGDGHVGTRLPEIVGFWIFCICLFRFVSVRTSVLAGTIAMLFPMVTTAYYYAYEARPHGIVLGFAGLALVCWQKANGSKRRAWWLAGMFASLLCAATTHTFAVVLVVPFALAEIARALSRRRIDWLVVPAIVLPVSGTLLSLRQFHAAKAGLLQGPFFPPTLGALVDSYQSHLGPSVTVLAAGLVLYFVFSLAPTGTAPEPAGKPTLEFPEVVAIVAFAAMPFFVFAVARLAGAPFFARYSISAMAGFGCVVGIVMAKRSAVGLGVVLLLLVRIGASFQQYAHAGIVVEPSGNNFLTPLATLTRKYEAMEALPDKKLPIVLMDTVEFFPAMHYAPADLAPRLFYVPLDFDSTGGGYNALRLCCGAPGQFETKEDFLSTHGAFYALANLRSLSRLKALVGAGADVKIEGFPSENVLVSVKTGPLH